MTVNANTKLNVTQILQTVALSLLAWQLVTIKQMAEDLAKSNSERAALKEDIVELKDEIRILRNLIFNTSINKESFDNLEKRMERLDTAHNKE